MKPINKYGIVLLTLLLLLFSVPAVHAETDDGTASLQLDKAKAYLIGTANGEKILKSSPTDTVISPSSTVKIMSGYLLCEYFANRLDEKITVTAEMVKNVSGRYVGMKAGATPTVRDLLYMGFCGGFNDAILILACTAYGSEAELVNAMNVKAAELGMKSTFYANATGLDSKTMYTTVGDLQKLAAAAWQSTLYMTVTSAQSYATEGLYSPFSFNNYNDLIAPGSYRNPLCKGMNAGNTPESGYAVVTVAEKKGVAYLCIVMGAEKDDTATYSYLLANRLISWAYDRYGTKTLLETSRIICEIPVTLSVKTDSVPVVPADSISAFVPLSYSLDNEVTYEYELDAESLTAPVEVGMHVGRITVYCDGQAIGTVALITKSGAEKSMLLEWIDSIRAFTKSDFFAGFLITALILTVLWVIFRAIYRGTARKRRSKR